KKWADTYLTVTFFEIDHEEEIEVTQGAESQKDKYACHYQARVRMSNRLLAVLILDQLCY
ncbi:hypothetical protein ACFMKB_20960, partial [Acinetobacter baumannii]